MKKNLTSVNKEVFDNFLKDKEITKKQGEIFHSKYYLDSTGKIIAYKETSSWNTNIIYMIEDGENYETLEIVKSLL